MAERYQKLGMSKSSFEIFERLQMLEECVECLAAAGETHEAKLLCNKLLE